jgi:peptide/nickel transport system ATP-binding protein/oligopeptide transport system ATP-binding protein
MTQPLLSVKNLEVSYPIKGGWLNRPVAMLRAVQDVSFDLMPGKTLGLVGESGCGKSTLGRALLRLQPDNGGQILFEGQDLAALDAPSLRAFRRKAQMIFQDPFGSLNPRMTIRAIVREPLDTHHIGTAEERDLEVTRLLDTCGLRPEHADRYPHEFSGGQRQRIGIARALALRPRLIVADEPVSALDVSVRSQILNLIADLQRDFGITFVFISHDLAVVQHISHDVGVMYFGHLVEKGPVEQIFQNPLHPYTQALLEAAPQPDPTRAPRRELIKGDLPSHLNPPPGCPFAARCPHVKAICTEALPVMTSPIASQPEHQVRCILHPG